MNCRGGVLLVRCKGRAYEACQIIEKAGGRIGAPVHASAAASS